MSEYYPIPETEFAEFCTSLGFRLLTKELAPDLSHTTEQVYGKRIAADLSLRIYSGVVPGAGSRSCGEDAIRVVLMYRWTRVPEHAPPSVNIRPTCGSIKVYRVKGWKKNLQRAVTKLSNPASCPRCPKCNSAMIERPYNAPSFLGCCRYPECKGSRPLEK